MSNKKEKRSAREKELERRVERFLKNPFFNTEPVQQYCEIIKEKAYEDCDDCSYINFNEGKQYLPSGIHHLTGETVVMVNRMYADPVWMQYGAEDIPDAETFIGEVDDPVTCIPKTRAFWRCKLEETGEDHLSELESLYTVALADYTFEPHNGKADNTTVNYALITGFTNNTMFELDFYEAPSIKIIREFIADISAALKANPDKKYKDMPSKEIFMEFIAKLTIMEKRDPLPSVSENTAVSENGKIDRSHYQKFDKSFKIATVKRIKEKRLPVAQVAKETGIHNSGVHHWISEYEKHGENAFRGRGRVSPDKKKVNDRLFQDVADDKEKIEEDGFRGRNTPDRKKYDSKLKMAAVKLVKENNQPISQVEKNLGIGSGNIKQWLLQYEKYGENAFKGSGSVSPYPDKRSLIKEIFKDEIAAAPDTPATIDTAKYGALNLTPEKEKRLAACSYKLRKYGDNFKISVVKRIKDNQLPVPQVSEELGIDVSLLNGWIRDYDELGENAFPGPGSNPDSNRNIDSPVQNDTAKTTVAGADHVAEKVGSKGKKVYGREFKMDAVKSVNDNKLSAFQVAKELNLPYVNLNKWIRLYKKHGDNAFQGSGVYYGEIESR